MTVENECYVKFANESSKNKTPSSVHVFPQRPEGEVKYIIAQIWIKTSTYALEADL